MKKISYSLLIFFLFLTSWTYAQCDLRVRCYVYDTQNQVVPQVHITLNGKTNVSNQKGYAEYTQICPENIKIECSCIGFQKQNYHFHLEKDTVIKIFLEQEHYQLHAVEIHAQKHQENDLQASLNSQEINKNFLTKNNAITFVNTLEKIQGFSAINTGVGIAKPVIRGLSKNRVVVNDQGIKQQGQQWGTDHGLEIDQFAVERVELIKGANSLIYGSEGIAGVINILPPLVPQKNTIGGSVLGTYKSNNELYGTSLMIEGNKNDIFFRTRFSLQEFGDYKVPTNRFTYNRFVLPIHNNLLKNTAGNEQNWQAILGIKRQWGILSLQISNFSQQAGLFAGATGIPRAYQLLNDGNSRDIGLPRQVNEHLKLILKSTITFKKDFLEIDAGYQHNNRREESNPHAHGRLFLDSLSILALQLRLKTWTLNAHYHQFLGDKSKLIYGFNLEKQQNTIGGYEFLIPNFEQSSWGFFVLQNYDWNEKIRLDFGLRYDRATQKSDKFMDIFYEQRTGKTNRIEDLKRNYQNFSGALGLSWLMSEKLSTKIHIGKSFRFPNISELASNGIHHGTFRHEMGNTNLNIEEAYQFDASLSWKNNIFDFSFTPYFNYFTNYIYLRPKAEFSPLPEGGQIYEYSQSQAITTGFESSVIGEFKNLNIELGMEYLYNLNLDNYLPLPFSPPASASLELNYDLPNLFSFQDKFYVNYYLKHTLAQNQVDRNELTTPSYTLMNLGTGFYMKIRQQRLKLMAEIRNLANENYMNHLSRYRLINLSEQGRNYVFTLQMDFGK